MEEQIAGAVVEARRVRGTVQLQVDGRPRQWCVAEAAADGRVELRVAEPRRGIRRWRPTAGERWLADHGFVHVIDAWAKPAPASADAAACARMLAEALRAGVGAQPDAMLERLLVYPGVLGGDVPPPGAPYEDHIAAGLRCLIPFPGSRASINGGTPSSLWGWVWARHERDAFVAEPERLGERFTEDDSWEAPMSADGARRVARELMRRVDDDLPSARSQPLFVTLIGTNEGDDQR
jgi:hypothetical protein